MTKLKDKLSASVRTVKATQQAAKPTAKAAPQPAPAKPAAPRATVPKAPDSALFPDRVWPD